MPIWTKIKANFRETFGTLFSPLTLFIWLTCIVVATVAGPFGTYSFMDWYFRAAYWAAVVSVSIVVGFSVRAVTLAVIGSGRPLLFDVTAIGLMTVLFAPVVWLITFFSRMSIGGQVQPLSVFAGYVMVCAAAVFVGRRIAPGFEGEGYVFLPTAVDPPVAEAEPNAQPRLLRRVSEELQGEILRLTASDHFVDVVTSEVAPKPCDYDSRMRLMKWTRLWDTVCTDRIGLHMEQLPASSARIRTRFLSYFVMAIAFPSAANTAQTSKMPV